MSTSGYCASWSGAWPAASRRKAAVMNIGCLIYTRRWSLVLTSSVASPWTPPTLRLQTCEGTHHCGRWNTAVAGPSFFPQSLFLGIYIELTIPDDTEGHGAWLDRAKGFSDPFIEEAVGPAAHRVFHTAIGPLESCFQ